MTWSQAIGARFRCLFLAVSLVVTAVPVGSNAQPLELWNDGAARQSIIDFVEAAIDIKGPNYIQPADRIAAFDQDGTLWVEQPIYPQAIFAIDRVRVLASGHPEWNDQRPFKAILSGDLAAIAGFSEKDWTEIIAATHAGMTNDQFHAITMQWLETARQPRFKRRYTELVYQPMLEVINYLRVNGFDIYIVTGGGQEFVRVYSERVYGIAPSHVIGSSIAMKYEMTDGRAVLMREASPLFIDDRAGKPVAINLFIGKRPVAAFGNSDGDREMLEWTGGNGGIGLKMLVLHDDPNREYAYGPAIRLPDTKVGEFSEGLMREAKTNGWTVISMKNDWKRIFPFE